MRRLLWLFAASVLALPGCGGDDNPASSSGEELLGTWEFKSTNLVEVMLKGLEGFLRSVGLEGDALAQQLAEFRQAFEDEAVSDDLFSTITFKSDGTFTGSDGDTGTWKLQGGKLHMEDDEVSFDFSYQVAADNLTLSVTWAEMSKLISDLAEEDDPDAGLGLALFDTYIDAKTRIEFVFARPD